MLQLLLSFSQLSQTSKSKSQTDPERKKKMCRKIKTKVEEKRYNFQATSSDAAAGEEEGGVGKVATNGSSRFCKFLKETNFGWNFFFFLIQVLGYGFEGVTGMVGLGYFGAKLCTTISMAFPLLPLLRSYSFAILAWRGGGRMVS